MWKAAPHRGAAGQVLGKYSAGSQHVNYDNVQAAQTRDTHTPRMKHKLIKESDKNLQAVFYVSLISFIYLFFCFMIRIMKPQQVAYRL